MLELQNQMFRTSADTDDPYSELITRFFQSEFPAHAVVSANDMLELLTTVIIGTNNTRFGPKPSPESQVAIREVIRYATAFNLPIPILVPWGGRKTIASRGIDVAEVVALKQLSCLRASVKEIYEPGVAINIRIEDTGAWYLYQSEGLEGEYATERYSADFQALIRVLNLPFINPIRESSLMKKAEYFELSNRILDPMLDYLIESSSIGFLTNSKHYKRLTELGWQGEIPKEQREYYWKRYLSQTPSLSVYDLNLKLAQYFAGSLARYKLQGIAVDPTWNNRYIKIIFVPPVPGAPISLSSRDIAYRTIPEKISRSHMPAWRSKGYFKITEDEASPRLASFNELLDLTPGEVVLSRAGESVTIQTDYLLAR